MLKGKGLAMAVTIYKIKRNKYKRPYLYIESKHKQGNIITIELSEDVTFINKGSVLLTLTHLPENSKVIIDGRKSLYIDLDVLEIIHDFNQTAHVKNIQVELINIPSFNGISAH
jgi:MFS superfamily sulfate permease-like transporter